MLCFKKSLTHFLYPWLNIILLIHDCQLRQQSNWGRLIGEFRTYAHGVQGTVYAVDESTVYVHNFYYDGLGPAAYFWAGSTQRPSPEGITIPYPDTGRIGDPPVLRPVNGGGIILKLPNGKKLSDMKWLAVWCMRFTVNFGEVFIPEDLEPPKPRVLPEFKRLAHGLRSGNITILDSKTFYIPDLHYDGKGQDTYFWVGNGSEPSKNGIKVPNEVGSLDPLRAYQGEDIEIQLPGNLQVYDVEWLAIYCIKFNHNFGHVIIPKDLDAPPSLGQTKISPPWWYYPTSSTTVDPDKRKPMNNCREMLTERLQVQWELQDDKVRVQLSAAIRIDQYIAFGISGEYKRPAMVGSDVVIAYYDENCGKFYANDYYISAMNECDGNSGVCSDDRIKGRNDVKVLHGERRHGITTIAYERPLQTNEPVNDKPISVNTKTNVIAAIGQLNSQNEPTKHAVTDTTVENTYIDFGSIGDYSCSPLESDSDPPKKPWSRNIIRNTNIFHVRVGPSGGKRGYSAVTKKPAPGLVWYINGKLIPEIYVERGKTYSFVVEGGNLLKSFSQYHPFYITDSPEGSFGSKTETEQKDQRIFGGISYDSEGNPLPDTVGRFCEWAHKTTDHSTSYGTFEQFFRTLESRCHPGEPAYLNWTVQFETPNIIYYQCYIHSYMGWKIFVEDPAHPSQKKPNAAQTVHLSVTINLIFLIFLLVFP